MATKNQNSEALVPELRFPEFRGQAAWEEVFLGAVLEITSSKRVHQADWTDKGIPFYRTRELVALHKGETITPLFISEDLYRSNCEISGAISSGDLLVTGVGTIGIPYLVKPNDEFYFKDGNVIWLKNDESRISGDLLYILYQTDLVKKQIKSIAGIGTVGTYTISGAQKTKVPIPTPAEQQKIADCLGSLDDLIAAHSRKLAALQDHKKGLLQQLFPAEGETTPKLRFPEFEGEWKERRIRKCAKLISGMHLAPEDYGNAGALPYFTGPSDFTDSLTGISKWTNRKGNSGQLGDTLITVKGSGSGSIWKLKLKEVALGRQLMALSPTHIVEDFLFYFMETRQRYFADLSLGNLIPGLSRDHILNAKVFLPVTDEQQKIADCLSALDALITAQADQIAALKEHKKGLMQKLFPTSQLNEL
jgi:type I restriction enzyme S subunit